PAVLPLAGYAPDEFIGHDFFSFILEEQASDQRAMFSSSLVAGLPTFSSMFSLLRKDGSELPVEASGSNFLHNPNIVGVIITLRDLTKQRTVEAKAEFYEHFDPLTSLPNRETFIHEVERAVTIARNRNRVFGVMALGLDRFKRINDLYGTETGDQVLKEIAAAIKATFRNDDVVSRYRGDKFFALFPEIRSQEHIKEIIAKAKTTFSTPLRLDLGESVLLSASIGVALYPNDGGNAEDLIRNAETALYMAKESGRDRYRLFDARLNGQILERQKIETDLNLAITSGGFVPYFQPKVDRDGYIVGAEALVRWNHPSGEIKQPGYFIDVAEKCGSIDSIGNIMLRMSCQMAASWYSEGLPQVPISINLSPHQFGRDDLIDDIKRALDVTRLDPKLLDFEVTESGIMENEKEGIHKLLELKELGAAISIDDFGTGYSSFSKLKDYPVDTVKIDKSFVTPLPLDRKATIIASAIIDLAHTLSFSVTAEGVETDDQLRFLDASFCDSFQGYLFSKPIPEHEFKAMLAAGLPIRA
ncbi:MAG: EAL domain-containing protein, partial [Spirochaetales bacterium]